MSGSNVMQYQKGEVIIQQGERQRDLYKILVGTVAFYTNHGKINEMRAGERSVPDYFGEIMLLADQPSYCTVIAETSVTVLRVSEEDFEGFLLKNVPNALYMVNTMAENLAMVHININKNLLVSQVKAIGEQTTMNLNMLRRLVKKEVDARLESRSEPKEKAALKKAQVVEAMCLPGHKDYSDKELPNCEQYLFEKEYTCPHCKHTFKGVRISEFKLTPIHDQMGKERYDFRMIYENFRSEWFEIVTCPYCCFSTFSDTFQLKDMPRKERYATKLAEVRAALPLDFTKNQNLDTVFTQHYLALLCAEAFQNDLMTKAQLWMNLSWLYEDEHDTALMEEALKNGVEAYKNVYSMCDLTSAQSQRIFLIIAGSLYRLGEAKEARQWLTQVKMLRDGKPIYANMADRLIQIIREEMDMEEWEQKR